MKGRGREEGRKEQDITDEKRAGKEEELKEDEKEGKEMKRKGGNEPKAGG